MKYNSNIYKKINKKDMYNVRNMYKCWKKLNNLATVSGNRGINIMEGISEPIACYTLGLVRNIGCPGDTTNLKNGCITEIKACSTKNEKHDLSSFSPRSKFGNLIFEKFDIDTDTVEIYDLHMTSEDLGYLSANKKKTVKEIRDEGKRPHI